MFVVTVQFTVAEDRLDDFLPLMQVNAAMSLSDEPGCQRFDVCQNPERRSEIFLYEVYDNAAAFEAHKKMPHYLDFAVATDPMVIGKVAQTYQLIEGGSVHG